MKLARLVVTYLIRDLVHMGAAFKRHGMPKTAESIAQTVTRARLEAKVTAGKQRGYLYRDSFKCPLGHRRVILRNSRVAGKIVKSYCTVCRKSYAVLAGPE